LDGWPPEGRTLSAILKQLISPASWSALTDLTGEDLPLHLKTFYPKLLGLVRLVEFDSLVEADKPTDALLVEAIKECEPLLEHWKSGALVAKGRRGDPLSPPVDIRPPTDWELWVANFSHSTIKDPAAQGKKIYDLRFFLKPKPGRKSTAKSAAKDWIAAEAKRLKAAGEVNQGTRITDFAKLLVDRMDKAHETDKSIRPVGSPYIKNMLPDWGLWPITSIK
jgi:hypothetical protein